MGLRVNHGTLLVGILAIVVLVLVFLVVPAITAQTVINNVGNIDPGNSQRCLMFNPNETNPVHPLYSVTLDATSDPFVVSSSDNLYPDMNYLMRCESQIMYYDGPTIQISGFDFVDEDNSMPPCVIVLGETSARFTDNWHQTISSSGNVVLSCRFKK